MNWLHAILIVSLAVSSCAFKSQTSHSTFEQYKNPGEQYIEIAGEIDARASYKIAVEYDATANLDICKKYNLVTDKRESQSIKFDYFPSISNGRHSLFIPLKEAAPDSECRWEPKTVFLCVGPENSKEEPRVCTSLFVLSKDQHTAVKNIDMVCDISGLCFNKSPVPPTEWLKDLNQSFNVNILLE